MLAAIDAQHLARIAAVQNTSLAHASGRAAVPSQSASVAITIVARVYALYDCRHTHEGREISAAAPRKVANAAPFSLRLNDAEQLPVEARVGQRRAVDVANARSVVGKR